MQKLFLSCAFICLVTTAFAQMATIDPSGDQRVKAQTELSLYNEDGQFSFKLAVTEITRIGLYQTVRCSFADGSVYTASRHDLKWVVRSEQDEIVAVCDYLGNRRTVTLANGQRYRWQRDGLFRNSFDLRNDAGELLASSDFRPSLFSCASLQIVAEEPVLQVAGALLMMYQMQDFEICIQ